MNKQFDLAEQKLLESLELFQNSNKPVFFSKANIITAKLYFEQDQNEKAYTFIIDGLKNARNIGNKVLESEASEVLSKYYAARNNFRKAYEIIQNQLDLKDSIYNSDMAAKISEMQTKYETEKKEKEIELLTKDTKIKELKINKQSVQMCFLISFGVSSPPLAA